jgi:hypothetical protein
MREENQKRIKFKRTIKINLMRRSSYVLRTMYIIIFMQIYKVLIINDL